MKEPRQGKSGDEWLKTMEWEKARDLAVDWYLPILRNDHKKIRDLEERLSKLERPGK